MQFVGFSPSPWALIGLAIFVVGLVVAIGQARGAGAGRQWGPVLVFVGLAVFAVAIVVWFTSPAPGP